MTLHQKEAKDKRHLIDRRRFQQLIQQQLGEDMDHDCEPLGKQGARGALFKISLRRSGYTLVGKGTVQAFVEDLRHEGRIYRRLENLQGSVIPVYLGNIDLPKVYYLDVGVRIQHMMMMAWAGEEVAANTEDMCRLVNEQVRSSAEEISRLGVTHGDIRGPNILWSRELKRVVLIDFERAISSRRKRYHETDNGPEVALKQRSINRPGNRRKNRTQRNGTNKTSKN